MFILSRIFRNARWDIIQTAHFLFLHHAEIVIYHKSFVDILLSLWYAEYVGAVIGTAFVFAGFYPFSTSFVKFHMETH
jgi:hypothetical protein